MQATKLVFERNEYIFRQGDPPTCAYLLEKGMIEIFAEAGEETILISRLGPGDLLGEMAVLDDAPRTASARAAEQCVLLEIDRTQLNQRLEQSDPIVRGLLLGQLQRYRSLLKRLNNNAPVEINKKKSNIDATDFDQAAATKIRLESSLRIALETQQLQVFYQPIFNIAQKKIAGYEALVRWEHPQRGPVSPGEFIALAEETSLIVPVGYYVLNLACETISEIAKQGVNDLPFIAVNISARQLAESDMVGALVELSSKHVIPIECIKFEITESLAINYEHVEDFIARCHARGILVALDDFGTGYSNLGHLHRLQFDTVKLDQSFIRRMVEDARSAAIVRATVQMVGDLGADMVAEGVESESQLNALAALKCKYAQGWLIGKAEDRRTALKNHI